MSPDYRLGSFTVVRIAAGVGVLPIDDEGNVYLNREFKYAVNKISIEAPSGSIAAGESPFSTAKRELREELGIEARVLNHLGRVDPHTTNVDSPAYLFLARGLSFKKPNRDVTEFIEPLKIKLAEAVEMVMNGTITYAQSIAVILKSNEYLKRSN
jgi:8-oxo-dGTP pyrophosphatase MutT (NUDIX family)